MFFDTFLQLTKELNELKKTITSVSAAILFATEFSFSFAYHQINKQQCLQNMLDRKYILQQCTFFTETSVVHWPILTKPRQL